MHIFTHKQRERERWRENERKRERERATARQRARERAKARERERERARARETDGGREADKPRMRGIKKVTLILICSKKQREGKKPPSQI